MGQEAALIPPSRRFRRSAILAKAGTAGGGRGVWAYGHLSLQYLPYGAFPAYFYLFTGVAFKFLRGRGLNLQRAILPYFLGQVAMTPVLLFERQLNLAMQTVVCRKREPSPRKPR